MASEPSFDLESLLQPIPGESPTGPDLRADPSPTSPYYQVKDARSAARADERQGLFDGVIGDTEARRWQPILDLGPEILKSNAKDLEIVAYMAEALARTHGFAGLRDAFRLARELVERFWDQLHPMPDEYGIETRVAPLAGLNGSGGAGVLLGAIARIPITGGSDIGPFATWNVDQAVELERLDPAKRAEMVASGRTDLEQIRKAVMQTEPATFGTLVEDIDGAIEEWKQLGGLLSEKAGSDAPPTSQVRGALEDALARMRHVAGDRIPVPEAEVAEEEAAAEGGDGGGGAQAARPAGPVASRDDALKKLGEIAVFFRRTEPHSPLAYLLDRAVRWGNTPLPELLAELIPDQGARNTFHALTGVQTTDPGGDAAGS